MTVKVAPVEKTAHKKANRMPNNGKRTAARSQKSAVEGDAAVVVVAVIFGNYFELVSTGS